MVEPNKPATKQRLGVLETPGFALTPAFDDPLPENELKLWNGEDVENSDADISTSATSGS